LYGSRAKDTADENSDYDLAIAYSQIDGEHTGKEYHTDELAYQWSKNTHVDISVIDINQVPVPLAYTVISDGKVIVCKNDFRLHSEESRIWSMWEAYSYEHAKNHQ
jgi:predicted nucleotidyltransferase